MTNVLIKSKAFFYLTVLCFVSLLVACKKQNEWLDEKKNNNDVVPTDLPDFQRLLNNDAVLNDRYPYAGIESTDNLYISDATYTGIRNQIERNIYIWAKDLYGGLRDAQ